MPVDVYERYDDKKTSWRKITGGGEQVVDGAAINFANLQRMTVFRGALQMDCDALTAALDSEYDIPVAVGDGMEQDRRMTVKQFKDAWDRGDKIGIKGIALAQVDKQLYQWLAEGVPDLLPSIHPVTGTGTTCLFSAPIHSCTVYRQYAACA
jgi:hypothetical protein